MDWIDTAARIQQALECRGMSLDATGMASLTDDLNNTLAETEAKVTAEYEEIMRAEDQKFLAEMHARIQTCRLYMWGKLGDFLDAARLQAMEYFGKVMINGGFALVIGKIILLPKNDDDRPELLHVDKTESLVVRQYLAEILKEARK